MVNETSPRSAFPNPLDPIMLQRIPFFCAPTVNVQHFAILESQTTIGIMSIATTSFAIKKIVIIKVFFGFLFCVSACAFVKSNARTTTDHDGSEGAPSSRGNVTFADANVLAYMIC
mmetsp:Transcript_16865/g.35572  ORF Transcript_16865/g.35572 Transcript_16865/m.35572 type:complete len:116 (-) Transcript_16865:167-514(-)